MVAETDQSTLKQPEWPVSMVSSNDDQVIVVFRMEAWKVRLRCHYAQSCMLTSSHRICDVQSVKGNAFPIQHWWSRIVQRIRDTIPDNSVNISWRYYVEKGGSDVIETAVVNLWKSRAAVIWAWDGRGSEEAVCARSFFDCT